MRVRESLSECSVELAASAADAIEHLREARSVCLLAAIPTERNEAHLAELLTMRMSFPHAPIVALVDPGTRSHAAALRLGAVGVSEVVLSTPELGRDTLREAVHRCMSESVASIVWRRASLALPERLLPIARAAIERAHEPVTVVQLAAELRVKERSLRRWCVSERLPSPQWIVGWARLLIAAYYLDEPGRTVDGVAGMLGFLSGSALRNQLRRYTELTMASLRAGDASATIARLFERAVQKGLSHSLVSIGRRNQPLRLVR